MKRRLPVLPTLLVLAAVGVMIALGFWQLDRLHQKEALLAIYGRAVTMNSDVALPADKAQRENVWFRHTTFECLADGDTRPMAGHNAAGQTGWAQWAQCRTRDGERIADVNLGWSQKPQAFHFTGGTVSGIIAPDGPDGARIVSGTPFAGLQPNALPDPRDIPNNHLSYAVQWFLFAATALTIYALALRKRLAAPAPPG